MDKRIHQIPVRLSSHERQQLQRLAGDLPLAQYLRSVGLSGQGMQPDWRRSLIEQVDNMAVALDDLKRQHPHFQERLDAIEQRLLDLEQRVLEESLADSRGRDRALTVQSTLPIHTNLYPVRDPT